MTAGSDGAAWARGQADENGTAALTIKQAPGRWLAIQAPALGRTKERFTAFAGGITITAVATPAEG